MFAVPFVFPCIQFRHYFFFCQMLSYFVYRQNKIGFQGCTAAKRKNKNSKLRSENGRSIHPHNAETARQARRDAADQYSRTARLRQRRTRGCTGASKRPANETTRLHKTKKENEPITIREVPLQEVPLANEV
ncbi:hypothetical protein G7047_22290 [Diaphorobacter sp. HDW4A]|uniref:hypothetical protein n=1 Tax=Diaphorobacter sp. HDW4A TaxID=2714924 RepID=UPI00140D3B50|nr:hypothetical protein [Diaphorobacter sp. HDW4A]QIL82356.1 hypothetical protein G7047_22290 [Diaphorobacter sp. HDW4A]